jgi:hypothetical protein
MRSIDIPDTKYEVETTFLCIVTYFCSSTLFIQIRSFRWSQIGVWAAYSAEFIFMVFPPGNATSGGMLGLNKHISYELGVALWILIGLHLSTLYLTIIPTRTPSHAIHLIFIFINAAVFASLLTKDEAEAIANNTSLDRTKRVIYLVLII